MEPAKTEAEMLPDLFAPGENLELELSAPEERRKFRVGGKRQEAKTWQVGERLLARYLQVAHETREEGGELVLDRPVGAVTSDAKRHGPDWVTHLHVATSLPAIRRSEVPLGWARDHDCYALDGEDLEQNLIRAWAEYEAREARAKGDAAAVRKWTLLAKDAGKRALGQAVSDAPALEPQEEQRQGPEAAETVPVQDAVAPTGGGEEENVGGLAVLQTGEPDEESPKTVTYTGKRIVRDTEQGDRLKVYYDRRCQVCDKSIQREELPPYVEAHHLQPLGRDHDGPDFPPNILILCPNHHAAFDFGSLAIDLRSLAVVSADRSDDVHGRKLRLDPRHKLAAKYLAYHWEQIFTGKGGQER